MSDRDNAADVAIGLDAFSDDDRAELETLARLPNWIPRAADESIDRYGQRALEFILAFLVIDSMTDEDLEQADRAAMIAVTARGISPTALDTLSNCRRRIQLLLIERRRALPDVAPPSTHTDKDNLGPMARLHDRPIARPPSGQKIEVQF